MEWWRGACLTSNVDVGRQILTNAVNQIFDSGCQILDTFRQYFGLQTSNIDFLDHNYHFGHADSRILIEDIKN